MRTLASVCIGKRFRSRRWPWASLKLEINRMYDSRIKKMGSAEEPNEIKSDEY
jgi:hypothetical protein